MNKTYLKSKRPNIILKELLVLLFCIISLNARSQTAWPSETWSSAVNLTSVMNTAGLTELSGLFWNGTTKRLYVSNGKGNLRVLQLNTSTNTFSQVKSVSYSGGPEGITQVNLNANEFYTADEDYYQIRKYTHPPDFSSVTLSKSWNLLAAPSTMTNTGNRGPEGITFVPDSFLNAIGFISQITGSAYRSVKGMGGLFFIANQTQGYIWVYDVNPNVTDDFAFVGKYQTNRDESCDMAFDNTTGLMYMLHNTGGNFLEVTDLRTTALAGGVRKFITKNEYSVANPTGTNINVEGFAINSKCTDSTNVSVWLCRDVESTEAVSYQQDCIRWFNPFNAPGACNNVQPVTLNLKMFIEGFYVGGGTMVPAAKTTNPAICDTVIVELHQASGQHAIAYSIKSTINTSGNGVFVFPAGAFGNSYYIVVHHRNALETWSASPVLFNNIVVNYSFTDAVTKAYGNNLKNLGGGNFAFFSGDIDQNGNISNSDFLSIKNKTSSFLSGYLKDDVNGDFLIESSDYSIVENNTLMSITVAKP